MLARALHIAIVSHTGLYPLVTTSTTVYTARYDVEGLLKASAMKLKICITLCHQSFVLQISKNFGVDANSTTST